MKKLSLLFAALLTATVMNLNAATAGTTPDMRDFLYFVGLNGNDTVRLNKFTLQAADLKNLSATFEYSKDRINWSAYSWADFVVFLNTSQGDPIALNQGDTVFFRAKGTNGKNATMSVNNSAYFQFAFGADDQIAAGGNTMSLYDATCEQDTMTDYGFSNLFKGANQLLNAPKVPAKTLKTSCYRNMFINCSSLVDAPALPATTLQEQCYYQMFKSCTSLTQAPELKATTLAASCYNAMFSNCTSFIQAPELKATILAEKCYMNMFQGCTSLEVNSFSVSCDGAELEVPTVSGTAPANWNRRMFTGCKGDAALTAENGIQLGGHYCIKEYKDTNDYLHFVSLKDNGTVRLNKVEWEEGFLPGLTATFEYSKDRKTWIDYTWNVTEGAAIALTNAGDTVFFRAKGVNGKNATISDNGEEMAFFNFAFGENDSIAAGGNVMSLYDASCEQTTMTHDGLVFLFYDAKQLVSAPKLPATTLANHCYMDMFDGCTGLTSAPALPATTLTQSCYWNMFYGCTSLTAAPELKATTLADWCYCYMFKNCTSLTKAPELKATTLAGGCYYKMFYGCTSLEVNSFSVSCDGAELEVPTVSGTAPANWNMNMFTGCKGDAALTAQNGIQLGGHYCIKEYVPVDTVQIAVPTSADRYTLTDGTMTQLAIESLPSYKGIYLCFKSGSMVGTFTATDFDYDYTFMEDYQSNYTSLENVNGTLAMYGDTIVCDFYMKDAEKNKWYHMYGTLPPHEQYDEKDSIWNSDFDNGKYNYDYIQDNLIYIEATQDSPFTKVVLEWKGNTLVPGVYNLDTIAGSFRKGYTDYYSLYGSYVYQPTPFHVWCLTQGTITVAENGDVTIDAMNTYDKTINCTIHLEAPVYGRKLSAKGNYGTICLRNAITATEGVEALYVPKYKDANFLYCEEVPVDSAKAGYAYIFQAQAAVDTVTFFQASGIPAVAAVEANYMLGWLGAATTIDNSFKSTYPGYALLMGNSVYAWEYCEAESQIMPNRAMINLAKVTTEQQPATPGRRMVAFGRNVATGLMQNAQCTMQSGKMMVNGQLVIIRDGKMFNAQGQEL